MLRYLAVVDSAKLVHYVNVVTGNRKKLPKVICYKPRRHPCMVADTVIANTHNCSAVFFWLRQCACLSNTQ